jgi:hypothetical protein
MAPTAPTGIGGGRLAPHDARPALLGCDPFERGAHDAGLRQAIDLHATRHVEELDRDQLAAGAVVDEPNLVEMLRPQGPARPVIALRTIRRRA